MKLIQIGHLKFSETKDGHVGSLTTSTGTQNQRLLRPTSTNLCPVGNITRSFAYYDTPPTIQLRTEHRQQLTGPKNLLVCLKSCTFSAEPISNHPGSFRNPRRKNRSTRLLSFAKGARTNVACIWKNFLERIKELHWIRAIYAPDWRRETNELCLCVPWIFCKENYGSLWTRCRFSPKTLRST